MFSNIIIGMDVNFSLNNLQYHVTSTAKFLWAAQTDCLRSAEMLSEVLKST